ncbi:DNA translocase FtsK [Sphingobacterium paramultivorum]|uniref:DNA translocase FtsK n=1 Tax=Sphingobacterium paramultivorum TaxID=2886510 RepID=A0A7G5E1Q9_9SPHI|nr:DNA translocase FtsK [Sphingobacterium paramultivorum]QMV67934.1 DNA translocase FtsK [Sphingobacterium paramultivorum]WSO16834.1 DNA translocase FtsK [Sphingobacterium paramultivorum]
MVNEINIQNTQQFIDLINNHPNDHPLKTIGLLFAAAINDWPTQNQTNINEFVQELQNYFGTPLTKESILAKTTSFSDEDAWRKESAASLLELLDLAETQYQEKNLEQLIEAIIKHYEEPSKIADSVNLVEEFGVYDEKLDLSGYQYPNLDLFPPQLHPLIEKINKQAAQYKLPLLLSDEENLTFQELYEHPNLLLAGTIASGKTQFIYNQLVMWLYKFHPAQLKLVICKSKPIDYTAFAKLEKHFIAAVPGDQSPIIDYNKALPTINALLIECEQRQELFQKAGVKSITDYNNKFVHRTLDPLLGHRYLPDIVIIMDDLQTFLDDDTIRSLIVLTQKNLYTGIYLLAVTSQIMARNISPQLRANFSFRIGMKLMSQNESKKILDRIGAEKLTSSGQLVYERGEKLTKGHQPYFDYTYLSSICEYIGSQRGYPSPYLLPEYRFAENIPVLFDPKDKDQFFEEAARLIVMYQQGSRSLIQRKLKLGYNRSGRIIDQLEAAGIIGPFEGSKPREVLFPDEYALEQYLEKLAANNNLEYTPPNIYNNSKKIINTPIEPELSMKKIDDLKNEPIYAENKPIVSKKNKGKVFVFLLIVVVILAFFYWMGKQ